MPSPSLVTLAATAVLLAPTLASAERTHGPSPALAAAPGSSAPGEAPTATGPPDVSDLPLRVVPARATADAPPAFVVLLSGDGGWRRLESHLAHRLADAGLPVVGWNSLRYFWHARTPDGAAADLDRVLRRYAAEFHRDRAIVVGYSQGADTVPFLVNRLPEATRRRVELATLVAPGAEAFFEFHVGHWLHTPRGGTPVRPEIAALSPLPVLCVYGRADADATCHDGAFPHVRALALAGDHGFDRDFRELAAVVVEAARTIG